MTQIDTNVSTEIIVPPENGIAYMLIRGDENNNTLLSNPSMDNILSGGRGDDFYVLNDNFGARRFDNYIIRDEGTINDYDVVRITGYSADGYRIDADNQGSMIIKFFDYILGQPIDRQHTILLFKRNNDPRFRIERLIFDD